MAKLHANGIEIEYEEFGSRDAKPLLLVMGLGAQMIFWHEDFCQVLAATGHRVIRYDNRDVGLSTKFDAAGVPDLAELMEAAQAGQPLDAPYLLDDMADDAAGVLDALDIDSAHVVGASMGGMVVQALAVRHPQRVRTLTSIMSSTGNPELPRATDEAMQALLTPAPTDRAGNIERALATSRVIGGKGFPFDEERIRERAGRAWDRCFHPAGVARQMLAILASGSRIAALSAVRCPALVIHGKDDPLVPLEGGLDTHRAIPRSELLVIEGMGHDMPRGAWPQIVDAISKLTAQVG